MGESSIDVGFKEAMAQWIELKKQLALAKSDLKVLTTQEKNLARFLKEYMLDKQIDACNTKDSTGSAAKVLVKTRQTKSGFSKALVRLGLMRFFKDDEDRVNHVMDIIAECAEVSEKSSISLKT